MTFLPDHDWDPRFEDLVRNLCTRPGMYIGPPTLDKVCAYIDGFDAARGGVALLGFREWLVVQVNGGNNLHWLDLASRLRPSELGANTDGGNEEERISALGRLVGEYFQYRHENGITKIFHDYGKWLLRKRWYRGPLRKKLGNARDVPL